MPKHAWSALAVSVALVVQASPAVAKEPTAAGLPTNAAVFFHPAARLDELVRLPGVTRYLAGFSKATADREKPGAKLLAVLESMRTYWPAELGLGASAAGVADVDPLIRLLLLSSLCEGAKNAGKAGRAELPKLQQALLAELKQLRLPRWAIWAELQTPAAAALLKGMLWGWLQGTLAEWKVKALVEGDAVGIRTTVGSLMKPAALRQALIGMDWLSGRSDRQAKAILAATATIPIEAWIVLRNNRLELRLGPQGDDRQAAVPERPTSIKPEDVVAFAQWDIVALKKLAQGWSDLWSTWKDSAAGREAKKQDRDDFLGTGDQLVRELHRESDRGNLWLHANRGLHARIDETGGRPSTPVTVDRAVAVFSEDAVAFDVDARVNLGERISASLSRVEDRLGLRSLTELVKLGSTSSPAQDAEAKYYTQAAALRELIHTVAPSAFEGSSAFVIASGSRVKWVRVQDVGQPVRTGKDLPVPAIAWIGRAKNPTAAVEVTRKAWESLRLAVANGRPLPDAPALVPAPPPAQGAQAYWLDLGWLESLTTTTVSGEGGFKPTIALQGNLFVLSTSPEFTRRALATMTSAAQIPVPPPKLGTSLVAWSNYPCAALTRQLRDGVHTLSTLFALPKETVTKFDEVMPPLCGLVQGFDSTSQQDGSHVISEMHLRAGPKLY